MVQLNFAEILPPLLPRSVGTFRLTDIESFEDLPATWRLNFHDARIKNLRTKKVAVFGVVVQSSPSQDFQKNGVRLSARTGTHVPIRAREWIQKKLKELDEEESNSGARNRFVLEEHEGYFRITSSVEIIMPANKAEALASGSVVRVKEFMKSFDKVFFQVACDSLNLVHVRQWYDEYVKKMNS